MRRLFIVVGVCLIAVLVPSAAHADDGFPAELTSWNPGDDLDDSWASVATGKEAIGGQCQGTWRSWRRSDQVMVVLKAFECTPGELAYVTDEINRLRQMVSPQWRAVAPALAGHADVAVPVPGNQTAHLRYWVEAGVVLAIQVFCPDGSVTRQVCVDLSGAATASVSAALPREPLPRPEGLADAAYVAEPAPCCANPAMTTARSATQALVLWRPDRLARPRSDWLARPTDVMFTDSVTPKICASSTLAWSTTRTPLLFLQWWTCPTDDAVVAIVRRAAVQRVDPTQWRPEGNVLGSDADVALPILVGSGRGHVRAWAQSHVALVVGVRCGELADGECAELTADVTRDISSILPGAITKPELTKTFLWQGLGLGLLLVGSINLVRQAVRRSEGGTFSARSADRRWHDVGGHARFLRLASAVPHLLTLLSLAGLGTAVAGALGLGGLLGFHKWWSVGMIAGGLLVWRYLRRKVRSTYIEGVEPIWRKLDPSVLTLTPRRVAGAAVVLAALTFGVLVLAVWVAAAWVYAGGGIGSPRLAAIVPESWPDNVRILVSSVSAIPPFERGVFLAVGLTLAIPLQRLGRRLMTPTLPERKQSTDRPHVLLLRDFDDDRILVPASRMSHTRFLPAVISTLAYPRRQAFNELLEFQLSQLGPVVAVAPRKLLAPAGPASTSYADDEWQKHVLQLARSARAVVFLGTPEAIGDGLRAELEIAATRDTMGHGRVVVVVPPRMPTPTFTNRLSTGRLIQWQDARKVLSRWDLFRREAARWPFFAGLSQSWIPNGVQVLAHDPATGDWHAWGSSKRTDWSYAAALQELTAFARAAWPDGYDAATPAQPSSTTQDAVKE